MGTESPKVYNAFEFMLLSPRNVLLVVTKTYIIMFAMNTQTACPPGPLPDRCLYQGY
jgi:hypothetical protein